MDNITRKWRVGSSNIDLPTMSYILFSLFVFLVVIVVSVSLSQWGVVGL